MKYSIANLTKHNFGTTGESKVPQLIICVRIWPRTPDNSDWGRKRWTREIEVDLLCLSGFQWPNRNSCGDSNWRKGRCNTTYMEAFWTDAVLDRYKCGPAELELQTSSMTCQCQHVCSCHLPNTIFTVTAINTGEVQKRNFGLQEEMKECWELQRKPAADFKISFGKVVQLVFIAISV